MQDCTVTKWTTIIVFFAKTCVELSDIYLFTEIKFLIYTNQSHAQTHVALVTSKTVFMVW